MQTITFTIPSDIDATKLLDEFCVNAKYDSLKQVDETKKEFLKRITLQWWFTEATQGKVRANIDTWRAEYDLMNIT